MFRKPNPSSGVPIYVQLKEQVRHAIDTGALTAGDQLPGIRSLAEMLVINPNTVIKVYRELEQEGVLEIRHGIGAFVISRRRSRTKAEEMRDAQHLVREFVNALNKQGLEETEILRLFEAEIAEEAVSLTAAPTQRQRGPRMRPLRYGASTPLGERGSSRQDWNSWMQA